MVITNRTQTEADGLYANALRYHQQGRLAEAVALYRKSLALRPHFAEAEVNLGTALQMQGELYQATLHFQRAIVLNPRLAEAHFNLGNAIAAGRRDPELSYRAALAIRPTTR